MFIPQSSCWTIGEPSQCPACVATYVAKLGFLIAVIHDDQTCFISTGRRNRYRCRTNLPLDRVPPEGYSCEVPGLLTDLSRDKSLLCCKSNSWSKYTGTSTTNIYIMGERSINVTKHFNDAKIISSYHGLWSYRM